MSALQLQNKASLYAEIRQSMTGLLDGPLTHEAALVSLIALLKHTLPQLSWVGFYRNVDEHLWISSYQGRLACVHLKPGQGVCGAAAAKRAAIIVEDVHAFPGHVFCDPNAASEIVLPVFQKGRFLGVLDLDSHQLAAFDAIDRQELEALLNSIEGLGDR